MRGRLVESFTRHDIRPLAPPRYKLSLGVTGATELTAAFHRNYPDAVFEFRKATAAAGTYRSKAKEAMRGWDLEA